jgi:hypothetical protein
MKNKIGRNLYGSFWSIIGAKYTLLLTWLGIHLDMLLDLSFLNLRINMELFMWQILR